MKTKYNVQEWNIKGDDQYFIGLSRPRQERHMGCQCAQTKFCIYFVGAININGNEFRFFIRFFRCFTQTFSSIQHRLILCKSFIECIVN